MVGFFSKRYKDALANKKLPHRSFGRALRKRLAMVCRDPSEEWGSSSWDYTNSEIEAVEALKKAYGKDELRVQDEPSGGHRAASDFSDFMVFAYPHHVLDALEAFCCEVPDPKRLGLQANLNAILEEERSPWRMADGRMFLADDRFVAALKAMPRMR